MSRARMTAQCIVVGISPFHDTSIAVGPFRVSEKAREASDELILKGWNTEIVELSKTEDIPTVTNDDD